MAKNNVEDKEMERREENDRNKSYDINEKRQTDGEDPSMKQQFPGDEIVDDLRELSRDQGQKDGNPVFLNGENVQAETDHPRYGDSISETADEEHRKEDEDSSSEWHNKKSYQSSGKSR